MPFIFRRDRVEASFDGFVVEGPLQRIDLPDLMPRTAAQLIVVPGIVAAHQCVAAMRGGENGVAEQTLVANGPRQDEERQGGDKHRQDSEAIENRTSARP